MGTEILPSGLPGELVFFAREFEDFLPDLPQERLQSCPIVKELPSQGLTVLLQELGRFGKAGLALVELERGGVGVLVPN